MDPREIQAVIEVRSVKGSLTRIQHFVSQFGGSEYVNEIKV